MIAHLLAAACAAALAGPCTANSSALSFRPYARGLSSPVFVGATPAEPRRIYVVEQGGRIRYLVNGRVAGTFLDVRGGVASGGEQGLLSVAFHPAYRTNHRFYVDYTDRNGDTRVVEYRSRGGKAIQTSARRILFAAQPFSNHNGGQLQFGPDGQLYVGMGDGGSAGDPGNRAQNLRSRLGKLLRTNPLARRPVWRIAGYGLRNPWRFSFDRSGGDLYIADVGQGAWEEVDYRPRSELAGLVNYGWNVFEGRHRFSAGSPSGSGKLVLPVHEYDHGQGCSITGGYVYRGKTVPAATGRYFFGDYCSGTLWSLRIEGGQAVDARREPGRIGRLTSFGEDAAGELYAASANGQIYRLGS